MKAFRAAVQTHPQATFLPAEIVAMIEDLVKAHGESLGEKAVHDHLELNLLALEIDRRNAYETPSVVKEITLRRGKEWAFAGHQHVRGSIREAAVQVGMHTST